MRVAAALLVLTAGVTAAAHHHKRPAQSEAPAPTSGTVQSVVREPLPGHRPPVFAVSRQRTRRSLRLVHDIGVSDVTMYCSTGNRNAAGRWPRIGDVAVLDRSIPFGTRLRIGPLGTFTVADWIGSGSRFDIFGGDDADCEQRALTFGRHHLDVAVAR